MNRLEACRASATMGFEDLLLDIALIKKNLVIFLRDELDDGDS
jgi:hypothetical protein